MTMPATAPARSVRLDPPREPAPDWWEAEFHRRQGRLRTRILRALRSVTRPLSHQELRNHACQWSGAEVQHALDGLVREEVVHASGVSEPLGGYSGRTILRVYYSTIRPEEAAPDADRC